MRQNEGQRISVLTPSFNYARFIGDSIESTLKQDDVNVEHIVQDAQSRDDTSMVLRRFGSRVVWNSEPDKGQADALNKAYERATGRWIAWLNADEFYLPGALSRLLKAAEVSGADIVYADCIFVDESGRYMRLLPQHGFSRLLLRWYGPFIPSCTVLMRKDVLGPTPWDPDVDRVLDLDLYLRLASEGARFFHVPYPVAAFRVHADRITAQPSERYADSRERVREKYSLPSRVLFLRIGRMVHALWKSASGAYARQSRAREFRGVDMRWFMSDLASEAVKALIRTAYADELR